MSPVQERGAKSLLSGQALPTGWKVAPLKRICTINPESLSEATEPELEFRYVDIGSVSSTGSITKAEMMTFDKAPSRARRPIRSGDIILAMVRPYLKAVALIEEPDMIASTGFAVLRPNADFDPRFLWRYLQSDPFIGLVVARSVGVSYPAISPLELGSLPVVLPPRAAQEAIADFLDRETARIDDLIAQKERLLELLDEQRMAMITRAVTKGLDPDVEMKDSGVEWIGEIPAHWNMAQLRYLTQSDRPIMYGIVLPGPKVAEGVPLVKGGDVKPGKLTRDRLSRTSYEIEARHKRSRLRPHDLVYAIRGSIGEVELVPKELAGANLTQDAARISVSDLNHPPWLKYALQSSIVFAELEAGALGATIRGINIRDLKRVLLPRPPLSEQKAVAAFINKHSENFNSVRENLNLAISNLSEYRTALISAAVTGKIDVQNWSHR